MTNKLVIYTTGRNNLLDSKVLKDKIKSQTSQISTLANSSYRQCCGWLARSTHWFSDFVLKHRREELINVPHHS